MAKINLSDIKGNSHIDRNAVSSKQTNNASIKMKPSVKPVVSSDKLVRSKKTIGQKIRSTFIQDDLKDIKKWVIEDVIAPGIKGLILDTLSMAFFHETYRRGGSAIGNRTSYNTYYRSSSSSNNRQPVNRRDQNNRYIDDDKERVDYRHIVLTYKDDAEKIVKSMYEILDEYQKVSIGDLYQMIDITPMPNDFNWGWTDPRDIGIKRVADGFLIDVNDAGFIE